MKSENALSYVNKLRKNLLKLDFNVTLKDSDFTTVIDLFEMVLSSECQCLEKYRKDWYLSYSNLRDRIYQFDDSSRFARLHREWCMKHCIDLLEEMKFKIYHEINSQNNTIESRI